ncbi:BamA/TamA family outer membrane protein [Leptolyngbya sp. AN02str]|uniref:BamA/TamA family outer membrane protein n=1 Tax=Leptolyngbya sp. AN02str TaxID=3423363 RepID=UPI003D3134D0
MRFSTGFLAVLTASAMLGALSPGRVQASTVPSASGEQGLESAEAVSDAVESAESTQSVAELQTILPQPTGLSPDVLPERDHSTAEASTVHTSMVGDGASVSQPERIDSIASINSAQSLKSATSASSRQAVVPVEEGVTSPVEGAIAAQPELPAGEMTAEVAQPASEAVQTVASEVEKGFAPSLVLAQVEPTESAPSAPDQATEEPAEEPRVLVAEVLVEGAGALENEVYDAITTQAGQTTTRSQLQQDINSVFATGFFSNVRAVPTDTPLGVRITFVVEPNPVLQGVRVVDSQVLPDEVVNEIFGPQYGQTLNLNDFQNGVNQLNRWYQDNGYVLAQVIDAPRVGPDGVVSLVVAEGIIEDIQVQFLNEDGEATNDEGEPIRGRTREFIITREFETEPGDVFNRQQIERDLQRAFQLGIFDDLRVTLNPGEDPRQVNVIVNVVEAQTGSLAAGVGVSSASGLFGTASYQQRNLGGNNQRLTAELQVGERDLLFDVNFTDPWIAGDPYRTSYTVNAFSRRTIPIVFQGGETEVFLPNGDRPRVRRLGGGVSFGRPLDNGWRASLGLQYQNIRIQEQDGGLATVDELGNQLSFSGSGTDDLLLLQLSASQDRRNSALTPTSGSFLRLSTEQSVPIGQGSILLNRLRGSYSFYVPVNFTNFNDGAETLAFNVQGGVVLGDLPPYEAFSLGGTDSVRGYDAGDVGSGRAFALASVEYRFPLFSIVGGALFADFGTTLGTDTDVIGEPSVVRGKPGSGFGYGLGVRIQSPIGPIRVDYGFNDEGDGRIHFGIGERF